MIKSLALIVQSNALINHCFAWIVGEPTRDSATPEDRLVFLYKLYNFF
jgi:hypothetical protein